jgi:hypothetical protein
MLSFEEFAQANAGAEMPVQMVDNLAEEMGA